MPARDVAVEIKIPPVAGYPTASRGPTPAVGKVEQFRDNPRRVTVFAASDAAGIRSDFWEAIDAAIARGARAP
jgi:hypothetical protein